MEIEKKLKECFKTTKKQEKKGIKHKGLLIIQPDKEESKITNSRKNGFTHYTIAD